MTYWGCHLMCGQKLNWNSSFGIIFKCSFMNNHGERLLYYQTVLCSIVELFGLINMSAE